MLDFDPYSRDEFWRMQNPGLSAFRGLLVAMAVSAIIWVLVLTVLYLLFR